ncbi:MAG TPA: class I SAM-dependent methyltransferase [Terriglobales bacterium]|nr:class I SAM-dependent methyltransferase [Terriglobales bacterium]
MSLSPRFLALLAAEGLEGKRCLDLGCGTGRLTLWLAPRVKHAVGLDRDARALDQARRLAEEGRFTNVEFQVADVDREDYARWEPDLITAHLCASDALVERAGRALAPRNCLAMVAFHVDQWRETGKVSRFAYDETRMERVLRSAGFVPEVIEVEREVAHFGSVEQGLAAAVGLEDKWRADGRWFRYIGFLEQGGRTLTRAHLIVKARRS